MATIVCARIPAGQLSTGVEIRDGRACASMHQRTSIWMYAVQAMGVHLYRRQSAPKNFGVFHVRHLVKAKIVSI
jgi:hypothetical protein